VLWERESGTVAEVTQAMNDRWEPELAGNTVLTYLRILREHGWVRVTAEGRGHRYFPAVPRAHVRWLMVEHLVELMFGGTREELLDYLITDRNTSPQTLERVRLAFDVRIGRRRPPEGIAVGGRGRTPAIG
jgi:BlaI family penicillinase repressor